MIVNCTDRMGVLVEEIGILKSRYQEHDTGHLRTAVSVLEKRVQEIKENIDSKTPGN